MQILLIFIRAHNPKVGGSNPSPATLEKPWFPIGKLRLSFYVSRRFKIFCRYPW